MIDLYQGIRSEPLQIVAQSVKKPPSYSSTRESMDDGHWMKEKTKRQLTLDLGSNEHTLKDQNSHVWSQDGSAEDGLRSISPIPSGTTYDDVV